MRPEEIIKHARKQPFAPFRVFISDGSRYDVHHPDMIVVSRSEVCIGIHRPGMPYADELAYCDPIHITRIEPLNGQRERSSRRRQ